MEHGFDQDYWDAHWQRIREESLARGEVPPHPYLVQEVAGLAPGTALEAGCGEGAEAIWLALAGWTVTAADIAEEPLARAAARATARGLGEEQVRWVRADLGSWEPATTFDLVTTHYAHPAMPQLDFYARLATWVAPGGSLLVVGHLHVGQAGHGHGHGHGSGGAADDREPPAEASVTAASITARLDPATWDVVTVGEHTRTMPAPGGTEVTLHDAVVRAVRRSV